VLLVPRALTVRLPALARELELTIHATTGSQRRVPKSRQPKLDPLISVLLSAVCVGAGQLYNRQLALAVQLFLVFLLFFCIEPLVLFSVFVGYYVRVCLD
jgi:hypothetical protein